jgi:hypothetical protein
MKKKQEIKPADRKFFAVLMATALALAGAIFYLFLTQPGTRATTVLLPLPSPRRLQLA